MSEKSACTVQQRLTKLWLWLPSNILHMVLLHEKFHTKSSRELFCCTTDARRGIGKGEEMKRAHLAELHAPDRVPVDIERGRPEAKAHHIGNHHHGAARDAGLGWKANLHAQSRTVSGINLNRARGYCQ